MKLKKITAVLLAGIIMTSSFAGCGIGSINPNAAVATMGDESISLGIVNFFCRYQQASMDDLYKSSELENVWKTSYSGDGKTMGDEVKSVTMETLHEMYTLQKHMGDYNVTISESQKNEITTAAKKFMDSNSKETLAEMGATQEIVEEMLTLYAVKDLMYDAIVAEADVNVSDEEANMRAYSYIKIDYNQYYDSQSYSYIDYTDDEKAAFAQTAQSISDALSEGQSLEEAAEAYGATVLTGTYDADDDALEENFKSALDALSEGETTGLVSTENSYYFGRIDAETDKDATEKNRESIIANRKDTKYNEVLEKWQEDDGWKVNEKQLAKIKFNNFFTNTAVTNKLAGTTDESKQVEDTESVENTEDTESIESTEDTEAIEDTDDTDDVDDSDDEDDSDDDSDDDEEE